MFHGFSQNTITFLNDLKANNNKTWFQDHQADYRNFLLEPLQELAQELTPVMLSIDPGLEVNPKKTISRIYRDIRFSQDKSPYRANMWLGFKRIYLDWKPEPAFFFEIAPDTYRYGVGFYNVSKETMDEIRRRIDDRDQEFEKIHSLYQNQKIFVIEGEKYKKILNPALPEDLQEWYQRKDLYLVCSRLVDARLFNRELVEDLVHGFKLVALVYEFFLSLRQARQ